MKLTRHLLLASILFFVSCSEEPSKEPLSQVQLRKISLLSDAIYELRAWAELGNWKNEQQDYKFEELCKHREKLKAATLKAESVFKSVYLTSLNRLMHQAYLNWASRLDVIPDPPRNLTGWVICDLWHEVLPPSDKKSCQYIVEYTRKFARYNPNWASNSYLMFDAIPILTKKISAEIDSI
ncbi:hypothetical protein OAQ34_05675 [Opitutales bacterium]|nr:hypothetical protein [Opitutales bacterium]